MRILRGAADRFEIVGRALLWALLFFTVDFLRSIKWVRDNWPDIVRALVLGVVFVFTIFFITHAAIGG